MKKAHIIILIAALLATSSQAFAQAITGRVIDEQGQPIAFATVVARSITDSSIIEGTITNDDGSFELIATTARAMTSICNRNHTHR